MPPPARASRIAVFLFSLLACLPFIVTIWNLGRENLNRAILAGPNASLTGKITLSAQREIDGERAAFVEYEWDDGKRASARIVTPQGPRPEPGAPVELLALPGDRSYAIPRSIHLEKGRPLKLKALAVVFALPPAGLWFLLAWAILAERARKSA